MSPSVLSDMIYNSNNLLSWKGDRRKHKTISFSFILFYFLLLLDYSCPHFPPNTFLYPIHLHFSHLILPTH